MRLILSLSILMFLSCGTTTSQSDKKATSHKEKDLSSYQRAYFASGCFWCVEAIYESLEGVEESISGYTGGHTMNPTYALSNTGRTGHAEANEIYYDPQVISYETLVKVYYASQDPTQVNGQGPDRGSQYRSIILYQNEEQKEIAMKYKAMAAKEYDAPIATEIVLFEKFWIAEDYHQDYEKLHPNQGYIRGVSIPRLKRFQAKHPELLKSDGAH